MQANFFSFKPSPYLLEPSLLLILQKLAEEGGKVDHLAKLNALLARNVVRRGEVEEDVGDGVAVDVLPCLELSLGPVRAQTDGDNHIVTALDGITTHGSQLGLDLGDAGLHIIEGLEIVLVVLWHGAREARKHLVDGVGDEVDLEGEGEHVLVDASGGDAGGAGRGLSLGDDGRQRTEDVLGHAERGVVQRVSGHVVGLWRVGAGIGGLRADVRS